MRLKTLRNIAIYTFSIVIFIALLLSAVQRFLGPEVKRLFISEINKSLLAEVQIDDVGLSLIKDFPFASVRFSGVRMKEALTPPSKNYLLTAGTISLQFNVWDLLSKKYNVKYIRLADVEIAPHVFADGSDNFHFWKPSGNKESGNFNFGLQRVTIRNLHIRFTNDASLTFVDASLPGFVAKGNFSNSKYDLDLAGNIKVSDFKLDGKSYLSQREINLWLLLDADNNTGLYTIKKGNLETGTLKLGTSGSFVYSEKQKQINLDVTATGSTFQEMLSLVPASFTKSLEDYKFEGKGDIAAKISGPFGGSSYPALKVSVDMKDGQITERKSGISLKNVSTLAVYSVAQGGENETLSISNLKARLGDGFVGGSLMVQGFSSPSIQCNLNASLNMNELQQFLQYKEFTWVSGWIKLNMAFDGTISDSKNPVPADFLNSNFNGNGSLEKVSIGLKNYGLPITELQSAFTFNNNDLQINKLLFKAGKSDFNLKGSLGNLLSWIFIKNESLDVEGNLFSQHFDWDELSGAQKGSTDEYQFSLPGNINMNNLQVRTTNFTFGKFVASNLSASAKMYNKVLSINNISMLTCQGKFTGQANINAQPQKHSLLQAKAHIEKVNVKTLFSQFGNFGQDDLKDQNLEGQISADVIFACAMQNNLTLDLNSIKVHADLIIENGRLVNYSPMQSLSSFLKVEDLNDIHFETLQNQIDIANQIIYIPKMEIKSSALNLQIMGTHSFDNSLEYHFTIALADLVAAKFKKRNLGFNNQAEFGPVEDDGRGRTKVYVSLTGTVENPIVKYDKKAMRDKISNDLKAQKVELKQLLKEELKWVQADTLKKAQQLKEKEILKKQEQGKFVIEWDDDDK
jgi:hypothetical protein